jgi:hypothetical protein
MNECINVSKKKKREAGWDFGVNMCEEACWKPGWGLSLLNPYSHLHSVEIIT